MNQEEARAKPGAPNDGHSEFTSSAEKNPFSQVETDIRTLMKKYGSLNHELRESQKKEESDIRKMLLDFTEVMDGFEKVFKTIEPKIDSVCEQTKIWIGNFHTVQELLGRALETAGVTPIETIIGEKANPRWHNVFEVVENPDLENGVIIEEIRKGYLWNGKLLRVADVKAVRNG